VRFLIDNARMALASWSCEANCFANNPQPDLQEGLGEMDIKPETIRFVVCVTRDLLEDASIDVEAWILCKVSEGMRATINAAILLGDGVGKPMGIMNPNSGIPICEVSPATAPGQYSWQDLLALKYEIPIQWQDGASYLMNQRTFVLLQTMSSAEGRPLFGPQGTTSPGTGFSFAGSPINIVSQMPDCAPGATPIAFGNWKRTYLIVWRKNTTMMVDPFTAGYCVLYKFEARVSGACTCMNSARLLRIR
jgi:HK97 family phage major capsid protein